MKRSADDDDADSDFHPSVKRRRLSTGNSLSGTPLGRRTPVQTDEELLAKKMAFMMAGFQLPGTLAQPCVHDRRKLDYWIGVFHEQFTEVCIQDSPGDVLGGVFSYKGKRFPDVNHLLRQLERKHIIQRRDTYLVPLVQLREHHETNTVLSHGLGMFSGMEHLLKHGFNLATGIAWKGMELTSQILRRKRLHSTVHLKPASRLRGEYVSEAGVRAASAAVMETLRQLTPVDETSIFSSILTPEKMKSVFTSSGITDPNVIDPVLCHLYTSNKLQLLPLDDGAWGAKIETLVVPKTATQLAVYLKEGKTLCSVLRTMEKLKRSIYTVKDRIIKMRDKPTFMKNKEMQRKAGLLLEQLKKKEAMLSNVDVVIDRLDEAAWTGTLAKALAAGAEQIKKCTDITGGVEGAAKVVDEVFDAIEDTKEVGSILAEQTNPSHMDDDDALAELAVLKEEIDREEEQEEDGTARPSLSKPVPTGQNGSKVSFTPGRGFVTIPVRPPSLHTPPVAPEAIEMEDGDVPMAA
eukprot:TRINITY_DN6761_c0_g3_i1.p1 TRINITY_DN6761_c0_g3~~TRINITY_DN6761_c0_g3_i1.p1  ORF type:complete len:534 (+),score=131.20 TRINITY_DN6761_c0_g3_i1:44-1603(+)